MSCIYFLGNRIIGFFLLFFLSVRLFDWAKTLIQSFFFIIIITTIIIFIIIVLKNQTKRNIKCKSERTRKPYLKPKKNKHVQSQNV